MAGCLPAAQMSDAFSGAVNFGSVTSFSTKQEVRCPPPDAAHPNGWHAFGGGGYFVTLDNHYSTSGLTHQSMPTADGQGWIYRGISNASDKLVVTVQCAPVATKASCSCSTARRMSVLNFIRARSPPANRSIPVRELCYLACLAQS